ncbi:hypothetical protein NKH49_21150 [Mesorhizobium sp. M1088]|uniref:hypothetical protein n=1 Tax=Mesorhizobium sp. M1088 TaxID=2957056 RepID=UPI00333C7A85
MRQHMLNAALAGTFAALLCLSSASAFAEVKKGDPGATCTSENRTINGQAAKCEICSATKCDTSGTTVSNCRKETTTTCTIGGRVVSPNPKWNRIEKLPKSKMQLQQ